MLATDSAPSLRTTALVCLTAVVLALIFGWQNAGLWKEGGAVELATVVTLLLVTGLFVVHLPRLAFGPQWHVPVLTALFAMRELDFDKRFTENGILKLRTYTGDAPLLLKLVGAGVIALALVCLYRLVARNRRDFVAALRAGHRWAILITVGTVVAIVAKGIDGLGRKLAPFGIEVSEAQGMLAGAVEESLEFSFAVALLLSLLLWLRRNA